MALFGGDRDAKLFVRMNKELINCIINTEVVIYQISNQYSSVNIYGESTKKIFFNPVRFNCLISREDKDFENEDELISYTQNATFSFLREDLKERNIVLSPGDVIQWDNEYYEVTLLKINQLWTGRNPESHLGTVLDNDKAFGLNVSITAQASKTTPERLGIVKMQPMPYMVYDLYGKP